MAMAGMRNTHTGFGLHHIRCHAGPIKVLRGMAEILITSLALVRPAVGTVGAG